MLNLTPELRHVRDFHAAFNHPIGAMPAALTLDRRLTRTRWILSELNEFALTVNEPDAMDAAVGMSDALCDALYFVLGCAVEMGEEEFIAPVSFDALTPSDSPKKALGILDRYATAFLVETKYRSQRTTLHAAAAYLANYHTMLFDAPIQEIFAIVHDANMAKLWPDGKPRYRESDGKVAKPEGWIPPEARIRAYYEARQNAIRNAA